jgi:glycosyltransferase involved in cell wall biosynthesis
MLFDLGDQKPDVSIIIRTKNEERLISQTLAAIFQQEIDLAFEVIIVDSGSTDGTLDIVRGQAVRLYEIEARDFSYGRALNYGARLAVGRYLINLSAHCIPTNNRWIANILNALRIDPQIAATYGAQVPIKGVNPFEERSLTVAFTPDDRGKIGPPFSNSNCAVRKEIWARYPFDEKASFAEDFIWAQMLPEEHKIKYVPEAGVYHSHPLQWRYWAKRSYDNGLFVQYLEHVYGLQYRWSVKNNGIASKPSHWRECVGIVGRHAFRCLQMLGFLIENRYLKFVPVFPIYWVLEQYYYRKGLADGLKLYGSSKSPMS